jgi:hypothetical protein
MPRTTPPPHAIPVGVIAPGAGDRAREDRRSAVRDWIGHRDARRIGSRTATAPVIAANRRRTEAILGIDGARTAG